MEYLRIREQKLRDTNESTNTRVKWFGFMTTFLLIALWAWQIMYLRAYFRWVPSGQACCAPKPDKIADQSTLFSAVDWTDGFLGEGSFASSCMGFLQSTRRRRAWHYDGYLRCTEYGLYTGQKGYDLYLIAGCKGAVVILEMLRLARPAAALKTVARVPICNNYSLTAELCVVTFHSSHRVGSIRAGRPATNFRPRHS
jgi:hypothetical protein